MTESRRVHAVCKHTRGSARSTLDEEPAELTHPARSAEAADATYERLPRSRACRRRTRACRRTPQPWPQPTRHQCEAASVGKTHTHQAGRRRRRGPCSSRHQPSRPRAGEKGGPRRPKRSMERSPLNGALPAQTRSRKPTLSPARTHTFATRKKHHQPPTLSCLQLR